MTDEGQDVWIWNGQRLRQLTSDPAPNHLLAWLPDGKRLASSYDAVGDGTFQLYAQAC